MKQRTEKEKKKRRHEHFWNNAAEKSASGKKKVQGKAPTQTKKKRASRVLRSCKGTLNKRAFFSFFFLCRCEPQFTCRNWVENHANRKPVRQEYNWVLFPVYIKRRKMWPRFFPLFFRCVSSKKKKKVGKNNIEKRRMMGWSAFKEKKYPFFFLLRIEVSRFLEHVRWRRRNDE